MSDISTQRRGWQMFCVCFLVATGCFNTLPAQSESDRESDDSPKVAVQQDDNVKLYTGSAQLAARSKFNDYEKATFSFEFGKRDDPEGVVRNDWDLLFGSDQDFFDVGIISEDRSCIYDLGPIAFEDVPEITEKIWEECVETEEIEAILNHMYVVHNRDSNSDHFSLFKVVELVQGTSCRIEWVTVHSNPLDEEDLQANGLDLSVETKAKLLELLQAAKHDKRKVDRQRLGFISSDNLPIIQIRTGAQGGNPSRMDIAGRTDLLEPEDRKDAPLDFKSPPNIENEPEYYFRGGVVPEGKVFLIYGIEVYGESPGDSNGPGGVIVSIGDRILTSLEDGEQEPTQVSYKGLFKLRPNQEHLINVELTNSSAVDVRFRGRLVNSESAKRIKEKPFEVKK